MTQTLEPTSTTGGEAPEPLPISRDLLDWVREVAQLTQPARIRFVDGLTAEWDQLTAALVDNGTFRRVSGLPNSFAANSDPTDVARVEDRTFICSRREQDAGPTNNWRDPADMKRELDGLFRGSMRGRTMFVVPFSMGSLQAPSPKLGVQITDSEYVVASMRIMTRVGLGARALIDGGAPWVKALHSLGAPLAPGEKDVPWPCNPVKYICHFPEERAITSFGSGYGGNALLGKKCYALRIASAMARDEGWLAEHMLILKLTSPAGQVHFVAAAFPSACGKTNLAMLEPTLPGWKAETLGDDIAWMTFGSDGRLYAVNPEFGLFGVAPGTGWPTNPNAMRAVAAGNSVFTNVATTDDGGIWWEGMTDEVPAHLVDWRGQDWTPESETPAAHPNSRFCTPIDQVPMLADEYHGTVGVPISAILFGGRRKTTVPLVSEARDWAHGVFLGATLSSETTAAATGAVGVVRRDPMAMLPFLGYDAGHYFAHWLSLDRPGHHLPAIYFVNWFRRDADGGFLWPGFGENTRVLKWIVERLEGTADAVETPIGRIPAPGSFDLEGLPVSQEQLAEALRVDPEEWRAELPLIEDWFDKLGSTVPTALRGQLATLRDQLAAPTV